MMQVGMIVGFFTAWPVNTLADPPGLEGEDVSPLAKRAAAAFMAGPLDLPVRRAARQAGPGVVHRGRRCDAAAGQS